MKTRKNLNKNYNLMFANLIQIPGLQDWWLNGHGNGLCTGFTTKLDYKISISYKNLFFHEIYHTQYSS